MSNRTKRGIRYQVQVLMHCNILKMLGSGLTIYDLKSLYMDKTLSLVSIQYIDDILTTKAKSVFLINNCHEPYSIESFYSLK